MSDRMTNESDPLRRPASDPGAADYGSPREVDLSQSDRVRESLQLLARELTGSLTLREVGRLLARESRRLFGHHAFYCDVCDEKGESLIGVYAEDTPEGATEPVEVPVSGSGPAGRDASASLKGLPVLYNRPDQPPEQPLSPFGCTQRLSRSLMYAPVWWKGRVVGVVSAQSYASRRYGPRDLELLQVFADQLGGVVARIRAEEALRESEQRYRQLVDLSPDPIVVVQNERCCLVSQAFSRLFGYGPADIEKPPGFLDMVAGAYRERVLSRWRDQIAGKPVPPLCRLDFLAKDGSVIPCEASSSLIVHQGQPAVLMVIRDVRDRADGPRG